jgi:hypothetical protein
MDEIGEAKIGTSSKGDAYVLPMQAGGGVGLEPGDIRGD